jgi:ABC-type Fe3+/spermidine/putrescine transport system ATPase subunit
MKGLINDPVVEVRNLFKRYAGKEVKRNAVDGINLKIERGEVYSFLGPSGCGKSTTIRMIAGLERPTSGQIIIDNETVFCSDQRIDVPVEKRPISVVFQSYAIWPHMNVFENISFPLKMMKPRLKASEIKARTEQVIEIVGLSDFAYRPATDLSGGQQQRVALARAIIKEPKILLLDEPLSNLDARLRERMREQILEIQQKTKITCIFVTHDQSEALAISNHILVINEGRIVEDGTPIDIYKRPKSHFTAHFIGIPNILDGTAKRILPDNGVEVSTAIGSFACQSEDVLSAGDRLHLFMRPESFDLSYTPESDQALQGTVVTPIFQGNYFEYRIEINGQLLIVRDYHEEPRFMKGDSVFLIPRLQEILVRKDTDLPRTLIPASGGF